VIAYVEVLPWDAPREQWLAARREGIGASDIAAVLGISPWESPASLWYRKRGELDEQSETDLTLRGHRLEPVVADWFAEAHPEFAVVGRCGLVRSLERPWQLATPDRLLCESDVDSARIEPVAPLEVKTVFDWTGWGEPGTDDIPVHIRAQVLWQMDTLGLRSAFVAVFGGGLVYREYEVGYSTEDVLLMREAGEKFWQSVLNNERPELDAHDATTSALKELHPDIEDVDVEVDPELAAEYVAARALFTVAEDRKKAAENLLRDAIGDGRRAVCNGIRVATRSVYDQDSFDSRRFREDHPGLATSYLSKITINKLIPPRKKAEK
jgi:putative phage-type endonuclease